MPQPLPRTVRPAALVGRDDELTLVDEALERSRAGRGSMLLLEGDAGLGKSALLATAAARARDLGLTVLSGRAIEGGGAFRPLVEALLPVAGPQVVGSPALAPYRPVLARLLPSWGDAEAETMGALADPVVLIGEALVRLLGLAGQGSGVLLTLDDLHWADPDTVEILGYLAGRLAETPVAVVAAVRSDERHPSGLVRLAAHREVRTGRLRPLDREAVAEQAAALLAGPVSADVVDHLATTTEGVPFVVGELLADLVEAGALEYSRDTWVAVGPLSSRVPASFAGLVESRLARLDPVGRSVVDVAAVLGPSIDDQLLIAASGRPDAEVAAGLRQGLETHLLVRDEATGQARWGHALTREAVLDRLLPLERQALSRRGGEALASHRDALGGDELILAADLLQRGGRAADAARLLQDAAAEAVRAGALTAAEGMLRRAEELASSSPGLASDVTVDLVRVLALTGRTDDAVAVAEREAGRLLGPPLTRVRRALARALASADRFAAAADCLADGEDPHDPRWAALAALVALGLDDPVRARELADLAEREGRELGVPDAVCEALEVRGRSLRALDLDACEAAFAEAERVASAHGLAPWRIRALLELGTLDLLRGGGVVRLERARELAADAGMLGRCAVLDLQIGAAVATREGHVTAAPWLDRARAQAGDLHLDAVADMAGVLLAASHVSADRCEEATRLLDEVASTPAHTVDSLTAGCVRGLDLWFDTRDDVAAADLFEPALAPLRNHPTAGPTPWWGVLTVLRTAAGDEGISAARLRESGVTVQAGNEAALLYADAVLAARGGAVEAASDLVVTADRVLDGMPYWRHFLHCLLARSAAELQIADVAGWLRESNAFFEERREVRLSRVSRDLMRELGIAVPRHRGALSDVPAWLRARGVTAREFEVLGLVAQRLSNGEIAQRLFLSPRTVETHVSNLLTKTGATSRAGLAASVAVGTEPVRGGGHR